MKVFTFFAAAALAASSLFVLSTGASAQATRTWVSGVGDDANPCSRTAPCKTFAGAISKTATGGEINCLDPAGFGAVTITKSIVIDCTGTFGSILASGTTGIIMNGADIDVVLRGLSFNGGTPSAPGLNGVRYLQGRSLLVEDSDIANFTSAGPNGNGLVVENTSGVAKLTVVNTTIAKNSASAAAGIEIKPTGTGGALVTVSNSRINNNFHGIRATSTGTTGAITVLVTDTVVSSNSNNGFVAIGGGGALKMQLHNVAALGNGTNGIRGGSSAIITVGRSVVSGNLVGLFVDSGAQILSFGDNQVSGNGTDGSPSGTVLPK